MRRWSSILFFLLLLVSSRGLGQELTDSLCFYQHPECLTHDHDCCLIGCKCCVNASQQKTKGVLTNQYYAYNTKDTIFFTKLDYGASIPFPGLGPGSQTAIIIDSIQINGVGSKELVFLRKCFFSVENHSGTFGISESTLQEKYEIWDLDSKSLLFSATSLFQKNCENYRAGIWENGICSWSYNVKINTSGMIEISDRTILNTLKTRYQNEPEKTGFCEPDQSEGTYQFMNGKYEKVD
ncbi:MAG: hypothetical protein KDD41_03970 [Flavobacteriales bacterium]|nr:hypothetical protein [Flavobacteriales bacterium]